MLSFPPDRPDTSQVALGICARLNRGSDPNAEIVLNIKSQGRWATFAGPYSLVTLLLRVGILEFEGDPEQWTQHAPLGDDERHQIVRSPGPAPWLVCPALDESRIGPISPEKSGLLVIDYDARMAFGIASGDLVTAYQPESGSATLEEATLPHIQQHLQAGHFRQLVGPGAPLDDALSLPLPAFHLKPGQDLVDWLADQIALARAWRSRHAPGTHREDLLLPLEMPGWTLLREHADGMGVFGELAPWLHVGELEAWERWARQADRGTLAACARQARLDRTLPPAGAPATPRPAGARL